MPLHQAAPSPLYSSPLAYGERGEAEKGGKGKSAEIVAFPCSATVAAKLFAMLFQGRSAYADYCAASALMGGSPDTWERLHQKKTSVRWELVYRMLYLADQRKQRAAALKIMGWASE
ncbi:MAG: hypothetical protein AAF968_06405 [Pseudomonadota bacterium]